MSSHLEQLVWWYWPFLVVAKLQGMLSVGEGRKKFYSKTSNVKKVNVNDIIELTRWIAGRFAALENLDSVVINRTWRCITEDTKSSAKKKKSVINSEKLSLAMLWRMVRMSRSMKQAKGQWLQNPYDMNGVFVNITQYDSSRLCRSKYLEGKIN